MPARLQYRSSSGGSFGDLPMAKNKSAAKTDSARKLFEILLNWRDPQGKGLLHQISSTELQLARSVIARAGELDEATTPPGNGQTSLQSLVLQTDWESGYTPLHWAVLDRNLPALLLLLRTGGDSDDRLAHRPIHLLQGECQGNSVLQKVVGARDWEGMTPLDLLGSLQRNELNNCRKSLPKPLVVPRSDFGRRRRGSSFEIRDDEGDDEFATLREGLGNALLQDHGGDQQQAAYWHGCEVLSFGRANHCALGVSNASSSNQSCRPQRVQEFALSDRGVLGSAVSVSAATHHTLVVTRDGRLFSFGLGKGGRLGLGDERHAPLPRRVLSSFSKRQVLCAAAAENHSLCVTSDGQAFAWGSNRFGQLGSSDGSNCFKPKRVDELRGIPCVAVAAGDKHSVALTRDGQVYTFGDNQSGQLGYAARGSNGVRRVESLWNAQPRKVVCSIDASERSTLVLVIPSGMGLPVNSVYSWGHGNHMPMKVNFETKQQVQFNARRERRQVNPVVISCAKYHNAAVSGDGRVFCWGLHPEQLGTSSKQHNATIISSPQLVTGMLPENGGGLVVDVAATEKHTAVVTDCGHMWTWGASNGKDILGHEGVRWQPSPRKVPGVHRAVKVAAAKEHTVFLMGTSFPRMPVLKPLASLEDQCARCVSGRVDIFNVLPLLIMAERTQTEVLSTYCSDFVEANFDSVLTVGRKSEMDVYLNEQLADSRCLKEPDARLHPLIVDAVSCGGGSGGENWLAACDKLLDQLPISTIVMYQQASTFSVSGRQRARSFRESLEEQQGSGSKKFQTGVQGCSERCLMLTANLDLTDESEIRAKHVALTKEIRGNRKRLGQITKLRSKKDLTCEEREKIARKPLLESDLAVLETSLSKVVRLMEQRNMTSSHKHADDETTESDKTVLKDEAKEGVDDPAVFRCDICDVVCPDRNHLDLHINGRKHRNRVQQLEEEENRSVTESIHESSQKRAWLPDENQTLAAASQAKKSGAEPRYRLPPPPLKVGPHPWAKKAETTTAQKNSNSDLRAIMAQEEKSQTTHRRSSAATKPRNTNNAPANDLRSIMVQERENQSTHHARKLKLLNPGPIPTLKSPPWLANPVATVNVAAPTPVGGRKKSVPLGEFLTTTKAKPGTTMAPWSCPSQSKPTVQDKNNPPTPRSAKSLAEIQQEEEDRANRASKSSVKDGKWFVETTEHAGSFMEIQEKAEEERQMRLLIEEQKQIELQIEEEKRQKEREAKKRNKQKKKGQGGNKSSTKGRRQSKSKQENKKQQENKKPRKQKPGEKVEQHRE